MKLFKPTNLKTLVYQVLVICLLVGLGTEALSHVKTKSAATKPDRSLMIKPTEAFSPRVNSITIPYAVLSSELKSPDKTNTLIEFSKQKSLKHLFAIENNLSEDATPFENVLTFGVREDSESDAQRLIIDIIRSIFCPALAVTTVILCFKFTFQFHNWLFHKPKKRNTVALLVIATLFVVGILSGM